MSSELQKIILRRPKQFAELIRQLRHAPDHVLAGAQALTLARSVAEMAAEKGEQVLGPDGDVTPGVLIALGPDKAPHAKMRFREGEH